MIGIICAMEMEKNAILEYFENVNEKVISNKKFYEAQYSGKDVVVCLCGVAKVNAAMTTTLLCEHYKPDVILNVGVAGGLADFENVMDLVASSSVVQHDFDTTMLDGEEGRGIYSTVSESLLEKAKTVLSDLGYPYHVGLVASGDVFVAGEEALNKILKHYPDAICAEMEAGAIGQVANIYGIDFVMLRSLSDVATKEKSEMDFMEFAKIASARSALFCIKMIEAL